MFHQKDYNHRVVPSCCGIRWTLRTRCFGAVILLSSVSIIIFFQAFTSNGESNPFKRKRVYERICPETGEGSAAPLNFAALDDEIRNAVGLINGKIRSRMNGDEVLAIISTTVNKEAARHNLPPFLESLKTIEPPLIDQTIVFCLDAWAREQCETLHVDPKLCLYMNLGVSEESLAPVVVGLDGKPIASGKDFNTRSYWRLTYGRVYTTLRIHDEGVNVLPVDADSVFLKNPLSLGEEIPSEPQRIAGVIDTKPFDLSTTDGQSMLNGGFLYFPATTPKVAIATNKVIRDIWKQSCVQQNEQLVTSNVIKEYYSNKAKGDPLRPRILSIEKYRNFCNTNCGTGQKFESVQSLSDLVALEKEFKENVDFKPCSEERRRGWVYFHAACTFRPEGGSVGLVETKGKIQQAMLLWARQLPV